jgi:hypothetical protein
MEIRDKGTRIDDLDILKTEKTSDTIGAQIAHQLQERLPLTNATNPLLSKAIEETGDYYKKNISLDWAIKIYALAIGYSDNKVVTKRIWDKIDSARVKVVAYSNRRPQKGEAEITRNQLLKADWRQILQKDIDKWKNYTVPRYEGDLKILNL